MIIKQLIDEDFSNYKKTSMFIGFPKCNWKCEKECGMRVCQNSTLSQSPDIDVDINNLVNRYLSNPLTNAIVCGGLEPFDSFADLGLLIETIREKTDDDIVIYTGYNKEEIRSYITVWLNNYKNIIIKYGRFIPNQQRHYDEVLGVYLASDNQYAEKIS